MSSEFELDQIRDELTRLRGDPEYKLLRDTIENIWILANGQYQGQAVASAAQLRELLEDVKKMQKKAKAGTNPREIRQEVLSEGSHGQTPPPETATGDRTIALGDVNRAEGDVIRAERDVFRANNITINSNVLLTRSIEEIKRGLDRIMVPVVLLVMTSREAQDLKVDDLVQRLNNSPENPSGEPTLMLTREKIERLLQTYGANPQDWRPFSDSQETIGGLVRQKLADINDFKKPLIPDFVDVRQLADDPNEKGFRDSLKLLRQEGCIVIMDIVSMHHKVIQRAYRRSLLDVYPNIPAIRMAPIGNLQVFDEQQMLAFDDRYRDMEIYKRLNWDEDDSCRDVTVPAALGRWIKGRVPAMLKQREYYKLSQTNVQSTYKEPNGD